MSNYNQYSGYGGNPYGGDEQAGGAYGSGGGGYGSNPYGENPYATDYGQPAVREKIQAHNCATPAHVY